MVIRDCIHCMASKITSLPSNKRSKAALVSFVFTEDRLQILTHAQPLWQSQGNQDLQAFGTNKSLVFIQTDGNLYVYSLQKSVCIEPAICLSPD